MLGGGGIDFGGGINLSVCYSYSFVAFYELFGFGCLVFDGSSRTGRPYNYNVV